MKLKQMAILVLAALALTIPSAPTMAVVPFQILPSEGFVPDVQTAERISEVILVRFVGEAQTDRDKPFTATLEDGVWIVKGAPPPALGGIAELHISKKDGAILFMSHGG